MLKVETTPNNAGVTISGDFFDFDQLYEALHEIVGDEDEYPAHGGARLRILGICYDLRHAKMGHRDFAFVFNGLTDEVRQWHGIVAPDRNVYLSIQVLWPELLFCTMALNDFAELRARKLAGSRHGAFEDRNVIWDSTLAQIRLLQAEVWQCIQKTVPSTVLGRIKNLMFSGQFSAVGYATQYLDLLNIRFLKLDRERRAQKISIVVKRLVEKDDEYWDYWHAVRRAAKAHGCSPEDLGIGLDYPEEIDW